MTIELSKETQDLLERALASGNFDSAEHLIQYSLSRTLTEQNIFEDETFTKRVKVALARSQKAQEEGRIRTVTPENHHELYKEVMQRSEERHNTSQDKPA